ncbi:MAG TPA: PH domain-containing protein [Thermoanaerobaculia bacterium]|nr:PH domain-containing protein [Thermoanaerobaculia bacterium]
MKERLKQWLIRVLKVPPAPHPPENEGTPRVFRAARRYYHYRLVVWLLGQVGGLFGLGFGVGFLAVLELPWIVDVFEAIAIAGFVAQIPASFLLVTFDWEMRWYVVTDRSVRIREGMMRVSEKTMSFANIQNLAIRQGPLQRLFGISDLEVRTAGGGGASSEAHGHKHELGEDLHLGYFRGIDNAEEIRDAILTHLRKHKDAGLGDPDQAHLAPEPVGAKSTATEAAHQAAAALLKEARALRAAWPG